MITDAILKYYISTRHTGKVITCAGYNRRAFIPNMVLAQPACGAAVVCTVIKPVTCEVCVGHTKPGTVGDVVDPCASVTSVCMGRHLFSRKVCELS